jgi:hypothetical protein
MLVAVDPTSPGEVKLASPVELDSASLELMKLPSLVAVD